MMYNPRFTGIHSSQKERQLPKCCVSFEKECMIKIKDKIQQMSRVHTSKIQAPASICQFLQSVNFWDGPWPNRRCTTVLNYVAHLNN